MRISTNINPANASQTRIGTGENGDKTPFPDVQVGMENLAAAQSCTADRDIAAAMVDLARDQVRCRAERAVSGDTASAPRTILRLLD